jgi:hypothetical protein
VIAPHASASFTRWNFVASPASTSRAFLITRDPRHDLAAELPKLHRHEEQRGDDFDIVQLDECEKECTAEVEDLSRRAGDADERDGGKKVTGGHPDRLLDYVAGP